MKNKIIDLAKQYATDLNGRTVLNCQFTSGHMALRIELENGKNIYVCYRIDGTEWKFDFFRQACVFHHIVSLVGLYGDDILNEYYEMVKCNIGAMSKEEIQMQQKLL